MNNPLRPESLPGRATPGELVEAFHRAFGLPVRVAPTAALSAEEHALRQRLLDEEVQELRTAVAEGVSPGAGGW